MRLHPRLARPARRRLPPSPAGLLPPFFFLCVERLDLRHIITGAAVFALQPAGRTGEMQRSRAAGALIICYLCWHLKFLLPMPAL